MSSNKAAYLVGEMAPLEIRSAAVPTPAEDEIVIKTRAIAINPCDPAQQKYGPAMFKWLKLPAVIGEDVAGEVSAVGSGVTKFKPGDRVIGLTRAAFQESVVIKEHVAARLPESVDFDRAAVIPLGLAVAIKSLFHPEYLALELPKMSPVHTGKTVLIWGGSTSVGCNAIQIAKAAGYEVITTASPANFAYVKKLGASQVYDYSSASIKEDLVAAFKNRKCAGAVANGGPTPEGHSAIVEACAAVVLASEDSPKTIPLTMVPRFAIPDGVNGKFVEPLGDDKDLAAAVFRDYLPQALEAGLFVPSPPPQVVGRGLESIQEAMDLLSKGVSAKKVVVTL